LNIDIQDDRFSATVSGDTVGFVKFVKGGSFTWLAQARVMNGALVATNYRATTTTSNKTEEIHITFANGNVKLFTIVPDPPINPNRISRHRRASPRRP
jgi:hypothetical protein